MVSDVSRETTSRVLAVTNQKGGVGKTTTAVNVATGLAERGQRVLCIDLDPQGNATSAFGLEPTDDGPTLYQALIHQRPLGDIVVASPTQPGLFVVPATADLVGCEVDFAYVAAWENRLRRCLETLNDVFEWILIDCPPSLGHLTVNAFTAAQELLVPIQCEFYALQGVGQLLRSLDSVRAYLNPSLVLSTILLTMYDARTRLADQVVADVRAHFGDLVLSTVIPRSVRLSEAPGYGQSVLTYDSTSRGAQAYRAVVEELLVRAAVADSMTTQGSVIERLLRGNSSGDGPPSTLAERPT